MLLLAGPMSTRRRLRQLPAVHSLTRASSPVPQLCGRMPQGTGKSRLATRTEGQGAPSLTFPLTAPLHLCRYVWRSIPARGGPPWRAVPAAGADADAGSRPCAAPRPPARSRTARARAAPRPPHFSPHHGPQTGSAPHGDPARDSRQPTRDGARGQRRHRAARHRRTRRRARPRGAALLLLHLVARGLRRYSRRGYLLRLVLFIPRRRLLRRRTGRPPLVALPNKWKCARRLFPMRQATGGIAGGGARAPTAGV